MLRGGTPGSAPALNTPRPYNAAADLTLPGAPFELSFREVRNQPDRCGFRIGRQIYAELGFREEEIPREYDRESGRLVLPE